MTDLDRVRAEVWTQAAHELTVPPEIQQSPEVRRVLERLYALFRRNATEAKSV